MDKLGWPSLTMIASFYYRCLSLTWVGSCCTPPALNHLKTIELITTILEELLGMPKLHIWLPPTAQNAKLLLRHMLRNLVFLSITTSSKSLAQSIQQFPVTHRQLFRQLFLLFSCLGKHQLGLEGLEFQSEGQLC